MKKKIRSFLTEPCRKINLYRYSLLVYVQFIIFFTDSIRNGVVQNLYNGIEGSSEMYLPLGDPKFNFQYTIAVTVMDKFYFGTKLVFNVTVSLI